MKDTIDMKDTARFPIVYRQTLEACYSCHKSVGRPYLRPQIPAMAPQPIINLNPDADWAEVTVLPMLFGQALGNTGSLIGDRVDLAVPPTTGPPSGASRLSSSSRYLVVGVENARPPLERDHRAVGHRAGDEQHSPRTGSIRRLL